MVDPKWGDFQKPNQLMEEEEDLEFQQELPGKVRDEEKPEGEKPQWGNFLTPETYQGAIDSTEEESTIGYLARNSAALLSRGVEQIAGLPGTYGKLIKDVAYDPKNIGILPWAISELVGPEKWQNLVENIPELPKPQDIKKFSQEKTGGLTKPKTKGEERLQTVAEDVSSTFLARQPRSLGKAIIMNLGIPAASNVVGNLVEDLGFGKAPATIAKLGTWLSLNLLGNINAPKYASELMKDGRMNIPENVSFDVPRLQQRLQKVANSKYFLQADPRNSLARQELAAIQNDLANGQTNVRSLMTTYDGINAAKRNRDLFSLTRGDQKFAKKAIDEVRDAVKEEIMESAKDYPNALKDWNSGLQAWATIHKSNAIKNWVQNLAQGPYAKILTGPAAALFGILGKGALTSPLTAIPGSIGLAGAQQIGKTAYRIYSNPVLANYYWNALHDASREYIPGFLNNYNKLNTRLKENHSKDKVKSPKK